MTKKIQTWKFPPEYEFDIFKIEDYVKNSYIPAHRHNYFEITWFSKTVGEHQIDFINYPIEQDRMFFIAPGQVHQILNQEICGYFIAFGTGFVRQIKVETGSSLEHDLFRHFERKPYIDIRIEEAKSLRALLQLMEVEFDRDQPD